MGLPEQVVSPLINFEDDEELVESEFFGVWLDLLGIPHALIPIATNHETRGMRGKDDIHEFYLLRKVQLVEQGTGKPIIPKKKE